MRLYYPARNISLDFFSLICYYYPAKICRVSISVIRTLPKPQRRVRLPYPAPDKNSAAGGVLSCLLFVTPCVIIYRCKENVWKRYNIKKASMILLSLLLALTLAATLPAQVFADSMTGIRALRALWSISRWTQRRNQLQPAQASPRAILPSQALPDSE